MAKRKRISGTTLWKGNQTRSRNRKAEEEAKKTVFHDLFVSKKENSKTIQNKTEPKNITEDNFKKLLGE